MAQEAGNPVGESWDCSDNQGQGMSWDGAEEGVQSTRTRPHDDLEGVPETLQEGERKCVQEMLRRQD